jgi:hypothetical protein
MILCVFFLNFNTIWQMFTKYKQYNILFFYHDATTLLGQDLHIIEDSRSHSDAPQSVGLLWTSDQPDAETTTSKNTQHSQQTNINVLGRNRTRNPSRPRPQTHALDRAATGIVTSYYLISQNHY